MIFFPTDNKWGVNIRIVKSRPSQTLIVRLGKKRYGKICPSPLEKLIGNLDDSYHKEQVRYPNRSCEAYVWSVGMATVLGIVTIQGWDGYNHWNGEGWWQGCKNMLTFLTPAIANFNFLTRFCNNLEINWPKHYLFSNFCTQNRFIGLNLPFNTSKLLIRGQNMPNR